MCGGRYSSTGEDIYREKKTKMLNNLWEMELLTMLCNVALRRQPMGLKRHIV